jgi:hypothetical protein
MNVALLAAAGGVAFLLILVCVVVPVMGYNSEQRYTPPQPVPFSHKHQVNGLGIDCRYCHTTVKASQNAGIPPTHTCMTRHSQIWANAEILAPVRQSLAEEKPLRWTRVYTLPEQRPIGRRQHRAFPDGLAALSPAALQGPLAARIRGRLAKGAGGDVALLRPDRRCAEDRRAGELSLGPGAGLIPTVSMRLMRPGLVLARLRNPRHQAC